MKAYVNIDLFYVFFFIICYKRVKFCYSTKTFVNSSS